MFVPLFENHHFKKKAPDRAAFASLLFTTAKSKRASSAKLQHLSLPIYFKLPPERDLQLCREVIALKEIA